MPVEIHQALHGYSEGHRQLACSVPLTPKDARLLLVMSDVSGPGVTSTGLPYLTGYPLADSGLYALSMTWPASEMPRPGCVWSHTLLVRFADLAVMDLPSTLADLFHRPSQQMLGGFNRAILVEFTSPYREPLDRNGARCLSLLASALYGHPGEQIWARRASGVDVDDIVLRLWDQQWPRLRRSFKFCTLTSRDRSQDALKFDLQLTMGGTTSARLRFASNEDGFEALDNEPVEAWLADLVRDAEIPTRSSLRQMLRRLGAEILGGREAMRPICTLHAALESPSPHALSVAVSVVQDLPPLLTSDLAKIIVARAALDVHLPGEGRNVLDFLIQNFELLSDAEVTERAGKMARLVWRTDPQAFIISSYEGGEKVRTALRQGASAIDREDVIEALPRIKDLAEPLLQLFPELAVDKRFWAQTQLRPSSVASLGIDVSSIRAVRAMVEGLRDEGAMKSALRVAGIPAVLTCLEELGGTRLPMVQLQEWTRQACMDLNGVASFLSHGKRKSQELLLRLTECLPPDSLPNDSGDDPWSLALHSLQTSEGPLSVELSAYGFRRALSWRSRSVEPLLRLTFEPLHDAAVRRAIPVDSWHLLEGALPWVSSNDARDDGLKLRRATAKKCVDLPVRPEFFVELASSAHLFVDLMDAVWQLWNGPRYIKSVKDWLDHTSEGAHVRQRRLVKQFIKDRSKFW